MNKQSFSLKQLLDKHIEALYTLNFQLKLVAINEPWDKSKPAPKLYIGKTIDGTLIHRIGCGVSLENIIKIEHYLMKETFYDKIEYLQEYSEILESKKQTEEIIYYYDNEQKQIIENCSKINEDNIKDYVLDDFDWLNDEIKYCQPCYGIVKDGRIISICRSVRVTNESHEAGIETNEKHRGNNLARKVLIQWATEVQNGGFIPFYSTFRENIASQRVAEKTFLKKIGIGISID